MFRKLFLSNFSDDGTAGDHDFSEYLTLEPVFQALQDPALFARATVSGEPSLGRLGLAL